MHPRLALTVYCLCVPLAVAAWNGGDAVGLVRGAACVIKGQAHADSDIRNQIAATRHIKDALFAASLVRCGATITTAHSKR